MQHVIANFFSQGLGIVGDVVKVPKRLWRNFLSQARLATYPTPENIAELNKELQVNDNNLKSSLYKLFSQVFDIGS